MPIPPGDRTTYDAPDDIALVRMAQLGDGEALGRLYDRHVAFVYRYLLRRTRGDAAAAEDLVQDTFVKVLRALDDGRFDPDGGHAFRGWLTRVAANACTDHQRRRASRPPTEATMAGDDEQADGERPAPFAPDPLPAIILDELLDELPPHARRVMRYRRHHPDLTEAECAERLEMTLEAYRKSVRRAFARLRELSAPRSAEILDATHPWQNRGAAGAGATRPIDDPTSSAEGQELSASARRRIRASLLAAHAALNGDA